MGGDPMQAMGPVHPDLPWVMRGVSPFGDRDEVALGPLPVPAVPRCRSLSAPASPALHRRPPQLYTQAASLTFLD